MLRTQLLRKKYPRNNNSSNGGQRKKLPLVQRLQQRRLSPKKSPSLRTPPTMGKIMEDSVLDSVTSPPLLRDEESRRTLGLQDL